MATFAVNKPATFDYEFVEKFTAGIVLTGHETKSAKLGRFDLTGSHAIIRGNEAYLMGGKIHAFQPKNAPEQYDETRTRKLILTKKEIQYLIGKLKSGLTLIPLKAYTNRGFVKIELGLGKGRKTHDKRDLIKKRETERELRKIEK